MMSAHFTTLFLLWTWSSPTVDAARQSLIANSDRWFFWLVMSSIVVGIGVCLEAPEATIALKRWYRHWKGMKVSPENEKSFAIPASYLGLLLVIVGVAGEGVFEFLSSNAETALRAHDEQVLADTILEAGTAKDSAKKAHDEADAVDKKATALNIRLDTASTKMDDLDTRIAAQSPRAKLLVKAAPELFRKLAPFAGQRVRLFVCGQQGVTEQETIDTWGAIANILGSEMVSGIVGTKWEIMRPNLGFAGNCGAAKGLGQGVMVFVSKQASPHTMDAANALGHGLEKALPPSPNKLPGLIDPDFAKLTVDRGYQSREAPWTIVAYDQDLITVLVGEHP